MKKEEEEVKKCYLCHNNVGQLDYKDYETIKRFVTPQGKIRPKRKTGTCTRHQRVVSRAVKRARVMAILPIKRV